MNKRKMTWGHLEGRASLLAQRLREDSPILRQGSILNIYPIPTSGVFAGQLLIKQDGLRGLTKLVENPQQAHIYIDDIIDSGRTRVSVFQTLGTKPFYALVDKPEEGITDWVEFPWNRMKNETSGPEDSIKRILQYIGEDSEREGLIDTPKRVVKSYDTLFGGYEQDPKDVITVFEDKCDEMVILRGAEFWSTCEHHLLPFFGRAHIAYIPDGKVIGISKLARILEIYSRRVQIQERLTEQITAAIDEHLAPKGTACVLEAKHLCMVMRGVQKQQSEMITSSLTGAFKDDPATRSEFFRIIK